MNETPIILTIVAGILLLGGAGVLINRENSYWSDGTPIVHRDTAEQNIFAEFGPMMTRKGGKRKKYTKKHYKCY